MEWWVVIGGIVFLAVVFSFREHRRESRRLGKLFRLLAAKHRGHAKSGNLFYLPELFFENDHGSFRLGAMATSGSSGNGPFTYLKLRMAQDCGLQIRLKRRNRSAGYAVKLDEAYRVSGADADSLPALLPPRLARKILETQLPGLELRIAGGEISLHLEGYVQSKETLEEMIELAVLTAQACRNPVA